MIILGEICTAEAGCCHVFRARISTALSAAFLKHDFGLLIEVIDFVFGGKYARGRSPPFALMTWILVLTEYHDGW